MSTYIMSKIDGITPCRKVTLECSPEILPEFKDWQIADSWPIRPSGDRVTPEQQKDLERIWTAAIVWQSFKSGPKEAA